MSDLVQALRLAGAASAWKQPCRVVATSAIALSGFDTIDGVALAAGDRAPATAQASAVDNGIWTASAYGWTRADDWGVDTFAKLGTTVRILAGALGAGTQWTLSSPTTGAIEIGSTDLVFTRDPDVASVPALEARIEAVEAETAAATSIATPETLVRRAPGEDPTEFNSLRTSDVRGWPAAEGVQSTDLYLQGGQPHINDIGGLHTAGNFVVRMGFCDQGYESAQMGFVYGDGRLNLPEGEWVLYEQGYYSPPDYDPYVIPGSSPPRTVSRTPNTYRIHTIANPVTGMPVNLDVASENGWLRVKANTFLSMEVGSKAPLIRVLQGPGGIARELVFANRAQANGAVTVDLFGYDFDLDDRWVPYQKQAVCTLEVSCYDAGFNVSEMWMCRFLWRGGSVTGAVATSAFGKLSAPYGPAIVHAFTVGSARPENPTSTDGIIAIENGTGGNVGKLRLRYTGIGGVNMNQIAATLRVMVPAV